MKSLTGRVLALESAHRHNTYTLAMLRSLSEIAQTNKPESFVKEDKAIQIPYPLLVDSWIRIYYPLLLAGKPQFPEGRFPAFQANLLRAGRKSKAPDAQTLLTKASQLAEVRKEIRDTMRKGPILHTRINEEKQLFPEYTPNNAKYPAGILVPIKMWDEMIERGTELHAEILEAWEMTVSSYTSAIPAT